MRSNQGNVRLVGEGQLVLFAFAAACSNLSTLCNQLIAMLMNHAVKQKAELRDVCGKGERFNHHKSSWDCSCRWRRNLLLGRIKPQKFTYFEWVSASWSCDKSAFSYENQFSTKFEHFTWNIFTCCKTKPASALTNLFSFRNNLCSWNKSHTRSWKALRCYQSLEHVFISTQLGELWIMQ